MCTNLENLGKFVTSNEMSIEIYDFILQNINSFTKKELTHIMSKNKNIVSTIAILIYMVWHKKINKPNYKKYVKYLITNNNIFGYYYDAVYYIFEKQYDKAFSKLQKTIDLDPTFYIGYVKYAVTLLNKSNSIEDIDKAIKYLEKSIVLGSTFSYYIFGLIYKGVYNYSYLNINKSIEMFNKSIDNDASNKYRSADALGTIYLKHKNNLKKSFEYYKLASDNEIFESHYNLLYLINTNEKISYLIDNDEIVNVIIKYLTHKHSNKININKKRFVLHILKKNMKNNLNKYISNYVELVSENKTIDETNNNIRSMIYYHPNNNGYIETMNHFNVLYEEMKNIKI